MTGRFVASRAPRPCAQLPEPAQTKSAAALSKHQDVEVEGADSAPRAIDEAGRRRYLLGRRIRNNGDTGLEPRGQALDQPNERVPVCPARRAQLRDQEVGGPVADQDLRLRAGRPSRGRDVFVGHAGRRCSPWANSRHTDRPRVPGARVHAYRAELAPDRDDRAALPRWTGACAWPLSPTRTGHDPRRGPSNTREHARMQDRPRRAARNTDT